MEELRVVLVDDEPAAREVLENLLCSNRNEVNIVAQCENVISAVEAIKKHRPDAVFLDVRMPEYPGYELVKFFDHLFFDIVFVTAYDEYAIKAFELSAVDYIVKPVDRKRLNETLEKLKERKSEKKVLESYTALLQMVDDKKLNKLVISELDQGQIVKRVIQLDQLIAIEADGAYAKMYLAAQETLTVSRNLRYLSERLPMEDQFVRCHRSWIVNKNLVLKWTPRLGELVMQDQIIVKVSQNSYQKISELLS